MELASGETETMFLPFGSPIKVNKDSNSTFFGNALVFSSHNTFREASSL